MVRKTETKDLLTGKQRAQGWRDQFEDAPSPELISSSHKKAPPRYKRKTYLMTDELIRRVESHAQKVGVGVNEMNRYLLTLALDLVERGEHEIQVKTVGKRTLGV